MTQQSIPDLPEGELEALEAWLACARCPSTKRTYRNSVHKFYRATGKSIRDLQAIEIERFKGEIKQQSDFSRRAMVGHIRAYLRFAFKLGYLKEDIGRDVRPIKTARLGPNRLLSSSEVFDLVNASNCERDRDIILLLYVTGMRLSGLLTLTCGDIAKRGNSLLIRVTEKGHVRTNDISSHSQLWQRLKARSDMHHVDHPLFSAWGGKPLHQNTVRRLISEAAKKAGINKAVTPHWLRHSHSVHALSNGAPIRGLQKSLGHAWLQTTEIYLQYSPSESSADYLPVIEDV